MTLQKEVSGKQICSVFCNVHHVKFFTEPYDLQMCCRAYVAYVEPFA